MGCADGLCLCRSLLRHGARLPDVPLNVFFDCSFERMIPKILVILKIFKIKSNVIHRELEAVRKDLVWDSFQFAMFG